jgi:drug/metabolite transporter (DMT)-like permease
VEITSSVTRVRRVTSQHPALAGLVLGSIGVLLFSGSFPATKFALRDLSPWFVSFGRAAAAATLAGTALVVLRSRRPDAQELRRLVLAALGVVVASPLLAALALQTTPSAHVGVVFALLPAVTAAFAVLRGGERPGALFWLAALVGVAIVTAFALRESHGGVTLADAYLLLAVLACGVGYSEGAVVARTLGGLETICWALVVSLPLTVPAAVVTAPGSMPSSAALLGFLYVAVFSMFVGFVAWYAGLARGIARVSQLQLFQPLLTVAWSALLLSEHIGAVTALAALGVIASVAVTQLSRVGATTAPRTSGSPGFARSAGIRVRRALARPTASSPSGRERRPRTDPDGPPRSARPTVPGHAGARSSRRR